MIRGLRAFVRITRCGAFLLTWSIRFGSRRPGASETGYESWRREYFSGAARGLLDRLGVEVSVDGQFPEEPGFLVTNHLGYLDVLVLASLGPAVFVSRADVADWPVLGRLTGWCRTIYIDRARVAQIPGVMDQMTRSLATGSQVIFFPEGTSGAGDRVMPFRGPLFEVAVRSGAPVRVAALTYRTAPGEPPARDAVCWWGDAGFARHLFGLAGLSGVRARVSFDPEPVRGGNRKELSQRCQDLVAARFEPVTGSEGST